jgi:hypothetical protein
MMDLTHTNCQSEECKIESEMVQLREIVGVDEEWVFLKRKVKCWCPESEKRNK